MPFRKVSKWFKSIGKKRETLDSEADNVAIIRLQSENPDTLSSAVEDEHGAGTAAGHHHRTLSIVEPTPPRKSDKYVKMKQKLNRMKKVEPESKQNKIVPSIVPSQTSHVKVPQKTESKSVSTKSSKSSKSAHSKKSKFSISKSSDFNTMTGPPLTTAPIEDDTGKIVKGLDLAEALGVLLKRGIVEAPSTQSVTKLLSESIINLDESSSEASHTEFVKQIKSGILVPVEPPSVKPLSRSLPLLDPSKTQSTNTSFHFTAPIKLDDSMVKLKLERNLSSDSCTQYFALKSVLQLEPYLQDLRQQEGTTLTNIKLHRSPDQYKGSATVIVKQKGQLALSIASINEKVSVSTDKMQEKSDVELNVTGLDENIEQENDLEELTLDNGSEETEKDTLDLVDDEENVADKKKCRCLRLSKDQSYKYESQDNFSESNLQQKGTGPFVYDSNDSELSSVEGELAELILVLKTIKPSSNMLKPPLDTTEKSLHYMLFWNFLNISDAYNFSFDEDLKSNVHFQLNETRMYKFSMTPGIYLYLQKCPMAIELSRIRHSRETLIGKCNLKIGNCFDDINKVYESAMAINNKDLCLCYENLDPMNFGTLVVRFKIRGNQQQFNECRPPPPPFVDIPPLIESNDRPPPGSPGTGAYMKGDLVSQAELQAFQDGLNLVLVRNKALRTTQEEITQELKDRTTWMHEELKWRLTLQENAILCGKDPESIKWRQWKDDTTANVRYRPISHEEYLKDGLAHVEIEILELTLLADSKPMLNPNLTHLYIEFSFLNMSGKGMETLTMSKPVDEKQPVRFHFKKTFDIHIETQQATLLAEMIRNNETIPFTVVAQPVENRNELQSCYDFGVAHLMLFDLLQSRFNSTLESIPVVDSYAKEITIGSLKIHFVGILAIRSMALHLLTPPSFKIIR